jgi:hypothetical protein
MGTSPRPGLEALAPSVRARSRRGSRFDGVLDRLAGPHGPRQRGAEGIAGPGRVDDIGVECGLVVRVAAGADELCPRAPSGYDHRSDSPVDESVYGTKHLELVLIGSEYVAVT